MSVLTLEVPHYRDAAAWDWRLCDPAGGMIAYHEVSLDRSDPRFRAFHSLYSYVLEYSDPRQRVKSEAGLVDDLGRWIGTVVLGRIADEIAQAARTEPVTVRVALPEAARSLAHRPLELGYGGDRPLALQDVSFIFEPEGALDGANPPVGERLRMLAIFSVPTDESVLDLRRERHELRRLIRDIALTRGKAIELRILQYGATREVVDRAFREEDGWDIVHFSGHGQAGGLILESPAGTRDPVPTPDLVKLIRPGRRKLKLVTLSACDSAAATAAELLRDLGITPPTTGQAQGVETTLPAVAQGLVDDLGCAVLAMRYPVADDFAIRITAGLYTCLLDYENELPRALQSALGDALDGGPSPGLPAYSVATPALFGARARELRFRIPAGQAIGFGGQIPDFPEEPGRFIGRVGPLTRAAAALHPRSEFTGILFCGMAGAGKSSCALELAYRFQRDRFASMVWFSAPPEGQDTHTSLSDFARAIERRVPGLEMAHAVEDPERLKGFLPELKQHLEQHSVLIVLDNIESLLTSRATWKDDRWRLVVETLLAHQGVSRTILTSRAEPVDLGPRLLSEPITALSLYEAVLLARQLPRLGALMASGEDPERELAVRALHLVQGNPKLILLADGQAADPAPLRELLEGSERTWAAAGDRLDAFFEQGRSSVEPDHFLEVLKSWTRDAVERLGDAPRLLFECLSALAEPDRVESIVGDRLAPMWRRIAGEDPVPDLSEALGPLCRQGLVERESDVTGDLRYRIHPALAEAGAELASPAVREAVGTELAAYWKEAFQAAQSAPEEQGELVLRAGMRAAPYLIELRDWDAATALIEQVVARDTSRRTLALLSPLLQRIIDEIGDSPASLAPRAVLAMVMTHSRPAEAEARFVELLPRVVSENDFELASGIAGELINLLRRSGRLGDALKLVDDKAGYSDRAGFGPWTRLVDDGWRLQLLQACGEDERVLAEVARLETRMAALPAGDGDDEAVRPEYAREAILDAARSAALALGRWREALDFSAAILQSKQRRHASKLAQLRTLFNDYGPLIGLGELQRAQELLERCRECFVDEGYVRGEGPLRSAHAHLAHLQGRSDEALGSERIALREKYTADSAESIAVSHHNLGLYLGEAGSAHLLAAAVIRLRIGDRLLGASLDALALRALAPDAEALMVTVADVKGVRFEELCDGLPPRGAVADVLDLVAQRPRERAGPPAPHLNQIRVWVRQGRTRGWIAQHLGRALAGAAE